MKVVHRLVGYDPTTDRMQAQFDIPAALLVEAKRIAGVGPDDPDAAWSYPLGADQARAIARLVRTRIDTDRLEFFLEPFADAAAQSGTTRP